MMDVSRHKSVDNLRGYVRDAELFKECRSGVTVAHPAPSGRHGILKIGKALGISTGTVQRVVMEQPRPFDVDVAEAALVSL